jgi:uncharacterized RDD family membrane protein YckC
MEPQQHDVQPAAAWAAPSEEEGPAPGVRFAGPGARLIAYILDGILISAAWFVLLTVATIVGIGSISPDGEITGTGAGAFLLILFVGTILSLLYFPFFWARGGKTPGMRPFRIRVVRDRDGGPVGFGAAILRLIGYAINGMVLYIGFVWILIDKRRRGWHDLIAGTVVIEDPR